MAELLACSDVGRPNGAEGVDQDQTHRGTSMPSWVVTSSEPLADTHSLLGSAAPLDCDSMKIV